MHRFNCVAAVAAATAKICSGHTRFACEKTVARLVSLPKACSPRRATGKEFGALDDCGPSALNSLLRHLVT
jgi:hypothetical protein